MFVNIWFTNALNTWYLSLKAETKPVCLSHCNVGYKILKKHLTSHGEFYFCGFPETRDLTLLHTLLGRERTASGFCRTRSLNGLFAGKILQCDEFYWHTIDCKNCCHRGPNFSIPAEFSMCNTMIGLSKHDIVQNEMNWRHSQKRTHLLTPGDCVRISESLY